MTPNLETALAIVGRTGSGKTYAAKGLVEQILSEGRRTCVVDPTGAWWGLRIGNGGKGFPVVIFGGEHGDVPLGPDAGELLGRAIAAGKVPQAVVDVSEFSNAEAIRFLTAFFEALYAGNRSTLHLILDEADMMAPQNPLPETRRLQGAVNKIVRRGRIKGFRPMMITQRPQVIDKSVLSQVDTLIAMRLTSPQDRKAILGWVAGHGGEGEAAAAVDSLPSLPVGTGIVWSGAAEKIERIAFPPILTFDSSRAPEPGQEPACPAPMDGAALAALRAELAPVACPAPVSSKQRVDEDVVRRAYERGFADGVAKERADEAERRETMHALLTQALEKMGGAPAPAPGRVDAAEPPAPSRPPIVRGNRTGATSSAGLNSAARKMLTVLDTNPPVRRSWTQVATLAGLRARGGHFNAGRKALLDAGLLIAEGELVSIAAPSTGAPAADHRPAALIEMWAANLSGAAPKILRHLAGRERTKDQIAMELGMQPRGGHWNAAWKELRDNHLVEEISGRMRLTALFREG